MIGTAADTLRQNVVEIVRGHDETFSESCVEENPSSQGNYTSVRLAIRATGETQLKALHEDLMAHPLSARLVL